MTSRKLDLVVDRIDEQNYLDEKQLIKDRQTRTRFVDLLNKSRERLHSKTNFRERRFQDGLLRNEFMRLNKVMTTKNQRGNTVDTKMNTYRSQNFLLNPKNKDNIYNYIDNLNYVLDKHEDYRDNYHKTILNTIDFYNFSKDRYYANIFDRFYNNNNDKKWMSKDILFFLNRSVNDELKEDKDFKEAIKLNRYMNYLKNKQNEKISNSQNFLDKHIKAKSKYNEFYLERDDLLLQKANELKYDTMDNYNEKERDYYHKITMNKDELDRKHKIEDIKKKKREEQVKMMEDERRQRAVNILERENSKFRFANNKEYNFIISQRHAQIETVKNKEDILNKAKEAEIRNDRIFKNKTVYRKGIYEMPSTKFM